MQTPTWLDRLDADAIFVARSRKLFDDDSLGVENAGYDETSSGRAKHSVVSVPKSWRLKISTPERAILEALDELPGQESFHNIDMIFEGLVNLRPKLLTQCVSHCRSVKAKRLFFVYADKHNHAWLKHIDKSALDFGSGPRALVKGGRLHPVYRIYVPKELVPSGEEGAAYV